MKRPMNLPPLVAQARLDSPLGTITVSTFGICSSFITS